MTDDLGESADLSVLAPPGRAVSAVAETILRRLPHRGEDAPSETELVTELRISRGSARRALDALTAAGVLGAGGPQRPLTGTTPDGIGRLLRLALRADGDRSTADIVGVRVAVERSCVSAAAGRTGEHGLAELRRLVRAMRDPRIRPQRFGQLDSAFHLRIARAAGGLRGSLLCGLTDPITAGMEAALTRVADWARTARELADEHEHLADLIGHDRGAEAAEFVARHVEQFYAQRPRDSEREATDDVR